MTDQQPAEAPSAHRGRIYLLPMPLGEISPAYALPAATVEIAARLGHFVAESARTARRFLTQLPLQVPIQALHIEELNEHTPPGRVRALLGPALAGHDLGVVSEAGCPVVADPGAGLVRIAHGMGLTVVPLVGPSAPLLALMASGLGGQSFRFRGYLPQDAAARREAIVELQKEARRGVTQIFIETPYRNAVLLKTFLELGEPDLTLAVAADLTLPTESVIARTIDQWRRLALPDLDRRPAVFVLGAPEAVSEASRSRSRR